jgi:hypothetical protein
MRLLEHVEQRGLELGLNSDRVVELGQAWRHPRARPQESCAEPVTPRVQERGDGAARHEAGASLAELELAAAAAQPDQFGARLAQLVDLVGSPRPAASRVRDALRSEAPALAVA